VSDGGSAVILVYSTSHAVRGERLLLREGLEVRLVPVPRQFSSDCGVCLRVRRHDREAAVQILRAAGLEVQAVHDL